MEKCKHNDITFIHSQQDEFWSIFYLESYLFLADSVLHTLTSLYFIYIQHYIAVRLWRVPKAVCLRP